LCRENWVRDQKNICVEKIVFEIKKMVQRKSGLVGGVVKKEHSEPHFVLETREHSDHGTPFCVGKTRFGAHSEAPKPSKTRGKSTFGALSAHFRNTFGTLSDHIRIIFGTHSERFRNTFGSHSHHIRNTFGTLSEHFPNAFGTHLSIRITFGSKHVFEKLPAS
jgi:hypothetical protein